MSKVAISPVKGSSASVESDLYSAQVRQARQTFSDEIFSMFRAQLNVSDRTSFAARSALNSWGSPIWEREKNNQAMMSMCDDGHFQPSYALVILPFGALPQAFLNQLELLPGAIVVNAELVASSVQ